MSFEAEPLQPGFMVVHGNQLEDLRDLTVEWLKRHPLGPLENETILVQSNGIAQWLKLALAADTREEGGGCGIAAALDMQLPGRFAWQAYRAVLGDGHVPDRSPFDKELVTWRLMRLVPALLDRPEFEPLRRFLRDDSDMRKRHQLAERLADLLDQYQVYRADWLADWADGRDQLSTARGVAKPLEQGQLWQPALWRALLEDMGERDVAASRAFIHGRFMETVAGLSDRPAALPRRVIVFGISSLPRQILDVLGAIARFSQVLLCVHNPCRHYWADIVPEKDLLRAEFRRQAPRPGMPTELTDDNLHQHAHPLLAAWGKQGRDYIRLLDEFDEPEAYRAAFDDRIDLFHTPGQGRILNQLQDDILDLRPLRETRTTWTPVDPREDDSVRFHVAHSPQREVEILHDQLLHRFSQEKDLRPRDVIVMVPDIDTYAPHIQAVFGQLDRDDKRYIPFTISDQSARRQSTVITAVETLLALPDSRFPVSEVLDLLDVPALRERFGIGEDDLATLHRWIEGAGVRWGLHAEQRETLGLPSALEQNSWRFGLRRMLLGYAVGNGDAWKGTQPYDEVGGLEADLAGRLWNVLDALETQWTTLQGSRSPEQWGEVFESLLQRFFVPSGKTDGFTLVQLRQVLRDWVDACARAGFSEELPLTVVRDSWLSAIDTGGLAQRFLAGAVNFCTLMPMRAIPFRMVCLLGMNDGDYPRSQAPLDFDLMAHNYRPGDRSRREDDRYLLLEALLAARVWLHVSWVGRSIRDNTARPPSVLVGQLRDHLEAGWTLAEPAARDDDASLVGALTVKHPLQPFGRAYFDRQGRRVVHLFQRMAGDPRRGRGSLRIPTAGRAGTGGAADCRRPGRLPARPGQGLLQPTPSGVLRRGHHGGGGCGAVPGGGAGGLANEERAGPGRGGRRYRRGGARGRRGGAPALASFGRAAHGRGVCGPGDGAARGVRNVLAGPLLVGGIRVPGNGYGPCAAALFGGRPGVGRLAGPAAPRAAGPCADSPAALESGRAWKFRVQVLPPGPCLGGSFGGPCLRPAFVLLRGGAGQCGLFP